MPCGSERYRRMQGLYDHLLRHVPHFARGNVPLASAAMT